MREDEKKYHRIGEGCYLWKNGNNRNKLAGLRYIFDGLEIAYGELVLYLEPDVPGSSDNEQGE